MAISFKDKIAYVNKFADKSDEKLQKVIKLSVNIESPKLNLTDAQKDKIKSSLQTAFERIKKIEDEKGVSKGEGKKLKTPNLLQLAKQIKQKQGITFEQARTKAKQAFAAKKSGQANAIQAVLQDFKKKVGKIEYSRATTGTDIKRDMERPALKAGKRKVTTQGSTTNAYGTFKNKVGKVYYESRANRMDVNQPSKKRYPKLAKGAKLNDDLYVDQLAGMSGTRADAVKKWSSSNDLSKDDLLNIIQGLGRKQITSADFVSAVLGDKSATSSIVSYAKSGKGFKMVDGGGVGVGVKIKDIPNLKVEENDFFDSVDVSYKPKNSNTGRAIGRVTNLRKNKYEAVQNVERGVTKKVGEFRTKKVALAALMDSELMGGNLSEIVEKLEKESQGEFGRGGGVGGRKQILVQYDNGKKVLIPTMREAKSFIKILEANGHTNITLDGKTEYGDGGTLAGSLDVDNIGFGVMAKGGRTATNYAGKKSKETWGKHDLSKMYDNNLDLIADVVDYIQDLRKDVGESYARDFVYELMDVLKEGKITYNDGATLKFKDGGAIKGSNPSTGEKFGVVVGSLEKEDGKTTLVIRSGYSSRIKSYELRFDENGFLSAIGDFGSSTDGSYPDMNKGRLSVSNVDADNKKESIEAISKITSPSFAKKVYDYVQEEKMAKGGLTEHGLKTGDTIMDDMFWEDSIVVKNEKSGKRAKVNLNTGERKEGKMAYGGKLQYKRRKK